MAELTKNNPASPNPHSVIRECDAILDGRQMKELTKEQLEKGCNAFNGSDVQNSLSMRLRAAAPHLQLPIEPLTKEESSFFGIGHTAAIERFLQNRNAALLPKPVDARREKTKTKWFWGARINCWRCWGVWLRQKWFVGVSANSQQEN